MRSLPLCPLCLAVLLGCAAHSEPTHAEPSAQLPDPPPSAAPAESASAAAPIRSASSASSEPASEEPAPFDDTLAGVSPGVSQDELEKRFGKPTSKSRLQEEQATGEHVSHWKWPDGLSAMMSATSAKGKLHARLLMLEAPSKLSTGRGIAIGSSRKQVEAAYAKEIDKQASTAEEVIVGERLGGLRVSFDAQQRVRSLSLGSDGE